MNITPKISKSPSSYHIYQKKPFSIHISDAFQPQDGSLSYHMSNYAPKWLYLDKRAGILYGTAPNVPYDKPYKITITAKNELGFVSKSFIIKVICMDVVESIPRTLINILSLNKEEYGLSHIHPYTPALLEYIYYFYNQAEYNAQFQASLREAAESLGVKMPEKIDYKDFERLIKTINPDIEKMLMEALGRDSILCHERLNNDQLRNLYRLGSQQTGVHAIPVWNYWAYPDLYKWPNWNPISNIMDTASDCVAELKRENLQYAKQHKPKPRG